MKTSISHKAETEATLESRRGGCDYKKSLDMYLFFHSPHMLQLNISSDIRRGFIKVKEQQSLISLPLLFFS